MESLLFLRKLILTEIALSVTLCSIGFVGEPFLPTPLQTYLQAQLNTAMTPRDWILLPLDIGILGLSVVSWMGLWRGWRNARKLYTFLSVFSLPLLLFNQPDIASGLSQFLEATATLVGGLILGVLYFSEVRHRYDRPQVA